MEEKGFEEVMVLLIGYFVPTCYMVIFIHEITHYVMFKFQKAPIIGLGLFPFNFIKGKLIIGRMENYWGFNIISIEDVKSDREYNMMKSKVIINHYITSFSHIIWMLFAIGILILFGNKSLHIEILMMYIALFNGIMLYSSLTVSTGDIRLAAKFKDEKVFLSYLCSFEVLSGFSNDYIFQKVVNTLFKSDRVDQHVAIMINYFIDYCIFKELNLDDYDIPMIVWSKSLSQYPTILNKVFVLMKLVSGGCGSEFNLDFESLIGRTLAKTVEGKKLLSKYQNVLL